MTRSGVIHVAPTVFGSDGILGGGERYPLELARAMAGELSCELVTFGRRERRFRDPSGLAVRVLRPLVTLGHLAHPLSLRLPAAVASADLVHAHHMRSVPSRMAALTVRAFGRPIVVTDHGMTGGDWGGRLQRLFDRFLVVSNYSARELRAPPERTRVIHGGVDPQRFAPLPDRSPRGVLFVGRITPHKGIDVLLRALPEGAELRIAGTAGHDPLPPERDYPRLLRTLAVGRDVRFLGGVPDAELPALYASAAVVALPTVGRTWYGKRVATPELLGLVALESMACGRPVVASRIGGLPEVVVDGETGFLVEPGDVAGLHERLELLLADPALADRLGRRGRERVLERFTWKACAARCLEAYEELAPR